MALIRACGRRPYFAAWPAFPPTTPAAFSIGLIAEVKSDSGPFRESALLPMTSSADFTASKSVEGRHFSALA